MPVFSCGRSLYIDWRMVELVWGKFLDHVKGRGNCPGGGMSERGMSYTHVVDVSLGSFVHSSDRY